MLEGSAETYHGLQNLNAKWRAGSTNLDPAKSSSRLSVSDNVLYLRQRVDQLPVGLPVVSGKRWAFWYLVTAWRKRFAFRERLDAMGGIPTMPYELADMLSGAGKSGAAEAVVRLTGDVYRDDHEMLRTILQWLVSPTPRKVLVRRWRGCDVMLQEGMVLERMVAGEVTRTTVVSRRTRKGLTILGQAYRSPHVLWLRDAVCVAVGRLLGNGSLLDGCVVEREGRVGLSEEGTHIHVRPTPKWPFQG